MNCHPPKAGLQPRSSSLLFHPQKNAPRGQRGIHLTLGQYRLPNSPHVFLLFPQTGTEILFFSELRVTMKSPQLAILLSSYCLEYNRMLKLEGTSSHQFRDNKLVFSPTDWQWLPEVLCWKVICGSIWLCSVSVQVDIICHILIQPQSSI